MKKGPLNDVEKNAIDGLLAKGKSVDEIKEVLQRAPSSTVVEAYIKTLDNKPAKKYDHEAVLRKLAQAGIHGEDAARLIQKALKNVSSTPEVNEVYNEAIRNIGPLELMIRESANGVSKNVTIMTEAAAAKETKSTKNYSRSTKNGVFNPKTGESS